MQHNMSSWQCLARYNVIDTPFYHYFYLALLIILFAQKQRLLATAVTIVLIFFTITSISGCMSSIGALTSIAISHFIMITISFVLLFILSFFNLGNINMTYGIYAVVIYIFVIHGLFFRIVEWFYPSPTQIVSIGDVDVRGKTREEIDQLLNKAIVKIPSN
jgi:hypothetical protein